MVNFPTQIPDCDSHRPAILDLFFLKLVFVVQSLSLHWESLIIVVSVSIDFLVNSKRDALFHCIPYGYTQTDWDGLCDHWGMFHGRISLTLSWRRLVSYRNNSINLQSKSKDWLLYDNGLHREWVKLSGEWVQIGTDVYIHHKYQVKPHTPPWFSAAHAAAIVYGNNFSCLYQQNKSSKVKFRESSNRCKKVLETAKLAYATKTKQSIAYQKLGSQDFWWIANSVLNKWKSAIPPLLNGPEVLSSASDKVKLFAKSFSKNSNFDDCGISLSVFPSRTNLNYIIQLPRWLKKS